jgi:hypothetical protein
MWDYSSKQYNNCDGFSIHLAISQHRHHLTLPRNYHNNNYQSISNHLSLKDNEDDSSNYDNNNNNNNDNGDGDGDDNQQQEQQKQPTFDAEQLSNRIKEVEKSESRMNDQFTSGLQQRVQELQSSKAIEELLFNNNDNDNDDNNDVKLSLPVISFDALLPKQKLEGSTEDTTFIKFLINEIGLGGYFMMTSLEYKSRKIRRNGVLCKIEFLNAAASATPPVAMTSISNVMNSATTTKSIDDLPTSVNFVIVGKKRCRVAIGGNKDIRKNKDLKLRIGRWRRCYDENCEESQLGWGEERFKDIDVVDDDVNDNGTDDNEIIVDQSSPTILPSSSLPLPTDPKQWNKIEIEYKDLDNNENDDSNNDKNIASNIEKVESLIPYVDEWYDLASDIKTYQNLNVTATARVQWDQPYLTIEPKNLLRRVVKELGPRPNATITTTNTNTNSDSNKVNIEFMFWVAALINPLPALGVSLEIRGNILEANTIKQKLHILELGLIRSIQNLKGERRL